MEVGGGDRQQHQQRGRAGRCSTPIGAPADEQIAHHAAAYRRQRGQHQRAEQRVALLASDQDARDRERDGADDVEDRRTSGCRSPPRSGSGPVKRRTMRSYSPLFARRGEAGRTLRPSDRSAARLNMTWTGRRVDESRGAARTEWRQRARLGELQADQADRRGMRRSTPSASAIEVLAVAVRRATTSAAVAGAAANAAISGP